MTLFDFAQKGLLIDVPTAPTTALALGNGPLLSAALSFFVIPSAAEGSAVRHSCAPLLTADIPAGTHFAIRGVALPRCRIS
jgi:hypothetical protein